MNVLVLGGSRFNGLALVIELARTGHTVTVLNRGQSQVTFPHGVHRLTADRDDPASMRAALGAGTWDCVHDVSGYTLPQVQTAVELLRGRVGHYIFASSTVAYAATRILPIRESHPDNDTPQQNDYARNKLACERYLFAEYREHGFPATTVPFSMVFGPNNIIPDREQRMFARLLRGRPILIPGDGTTLGMVGHVDDQARGLRMMMCNPITFGRRYNLSGQDCYTDDGYVDVFAEVVGVSPRRVYVPAEVMNDLWGQPPPMSFRAAHLIQKVAPHIHYWSSSVFFSSDRLRRDVGWEPEYTFPGMVAQTYEWFRREGLNQTREFDFSFEDELLARLGA
jgi:nucleoside-diphosphate-sugar epimerase